MKQITILSSALLLALVLSCQKEKFPTEQPENKPALEWRSDPISIDVDLLNRINLALEAEGKNYRAVMAEYITSGENGGDPGRTVVFSDRSPNLLRLFPDFVPFDSRRSPWSGPVDGANDNITYLIDQVDAATPNGLSGASTTAAIQRAVDTWDEAICTDLELTRNPDDGLDYGIVAWVLGLGGGPYPNADIIHAGFTDINFCCGIVAATVYINFVDSEGNYTDINNDDRLDAAIREIYYDPSWHWAIDNHIDVETVALHEMGHGLSQGHFGEWFRTDANGQFHFSPRAVMNAGITGVQQSLTGTDMGGHCVNWGEWPHQ